MTGSSHYGGAQITDRLPGNNQPEASFYIFTSLTRSRVLKIYLSKMQDPGTYFDGSYTRVLSYYMVLSYTVNSRY